MFLYRLLHNFNRNRKASVKHHVGAWVIVSDAHIGLSSNRSRINWLFYIPIWQTQLFSRYLLLSHPATSTEIVGQLTFILTAPIFISFNWPWEQIFGLVFSTAETNCSKWLKQLKMSVLEACGPISCWPDDLSVGHPSVRQLRKLEVSSFHR